jgi:hypothetical protein
MATATTKKNKTAYTQLSTEVAIPLQLKGKVALGNHTETEMEDEAENASDEKGNGCGPIYVIAAALAVEGLLIMGAFLGSRLLT